MSLSLIKELWLKIKKSEQNPQNSTIPLNEDSDKINSIESNKDIKISKRIIKNENKSLSLGDYKFISDLLSQKFLEVRDIFTKFNSEDYYTFIENSNFHEYSEKDLIFAKNTPCENYLFILYGDIDFYDAKEEGNEKILIKTISAGKVYGHLVKEKYKYNLIARTNISLISINKKIFDDLIININKIKSANKIKFIKKFFPKIRTFPDNTISNVFQNFERVKFNIHSKILLKDEYNEYIYLIIKGQVGLCLRPKVLFKNDIIDKTNEIYNKDYIILEKLSKGDVFGINSALKSQKNFYTVVALTNDVEVYRIAKGSILYYFGGSNGMLPLDLKAVGDLQDNSCQIKINYLKNLNINNNEIINLLKEKFVIKFDENEKLARNKKIKRDENYFIIDEDSIKNNLFEAWKSCDNLNLKISELKSKLLADKSTTKKNNILSDILGQKEKESSSNNSKDFTVIRGDATNRVVSRKLKMGLNMNQLRSLDKLNMYSGGQKNSDDSIKKLADITSKIDGGAKNKLMSFMRTDIENEKNARNEQKETTENKNTVIEKEKEKEKEKLDKPKRAKNSLRKLREMGD